MDAIVGGHNPRAKFSLPSKGWFSKNASKLFVVRPLGAIVGAEIGPCCEHATSTHLNDDQDVVVPFGRSWVGAK